MTILNPARVATTLALLFATPLAHAGGSAASLHDSSETWEPIGEGEANRVLDLAIDLEVLYDHLQSIGGDAAVDGLPSAGAARAIVVTNGDAFDLYVDGEDQDWFGQARSDGIVTISTWDGASMGDALELELDDDEVRAVGVTPSPVALGFHLLDGEEVPASIEYTQVRVDMDDLLGTDELPIYMLSGGGGSIVGCEADAWAADDECDRIAEGVKCCKEVADEKEAECLRDNASHAQSMTVKDTFVSLVALFTGDASGFADSAGNAVLQDYDTRDCSDVHNVFQGTCLQTIALSIYEPPDCD